jgi:two-component system chemotaxis response regulator CheY
MKSLIVDDIGTIQRLLSHMLKEFGSCEYAQNGLEALEKQKDAFKAGKTFDLICLDIMMPEMDGLNTLKMIRSFEQEHGINGDQKTKIVMITALNQENYVSTAMKAGCDGYILKPIFREKLLKELVKLKLISAT